jgi:Fe2+ or Zn2+ uptake regulation protein
MGQFAKKAEAALRGSRRPITPARRALLKLLEEEERPLAPRELHSALRRRGVRVDRVSVYRNVATLLELGLLHRIVGSAAVRPCQGPAPRAAAAKQARCHHAIVCSGCGSAREFHSVALEKALGEVRRATRYLVQGHVLELRGLCARCQG